MFNRFKYLAAISLMVTLGTGCQQKCQAPETQAFRSLVDAQWRLVESTDPQVAKTLDKYNFLIVTFNRNNTGLINRVVDNDQFDTPILQLVWVPDIESGILRIQYSSVPEEDPESLTSTPKAGDQGTFDYFYSLRGQLEMYESKRGYYYRYVPFKGVADPDSSCTF